MLEICDFIFLFSGCISIIYTRFENTHEAIIDQETFDSVQRIRGNAKRYADGFGEAAPLTGLIYCADCGGKMYVHRTYNGKRTPQYTCSQYSKVPVGTRCPTQHRIAEKIVLSLVSDMLQAISDYAKSDRAAFIREVQEAQASQQDSDIRKNGGGWQRHRNEPESWNGLCVKFMRTTLWAVCRMPGTLFWMHSMPRSRKNFLPRLRCWKRPSAVTTRARNRRKSLSL